MSIAYNDYTPDMAFNVGDKIHAVIRHCVHDKHKLNDEKVDLYYGEDNWYFLDDNGERSHNELSWNWNVVKYAMYKSNRREETKRK